MLLGIPEGVILDEPCVFLSRGQGRAGDYGGLCYYW